MTHIEAIRNAATPKERAALRREVNAQLRVEDREIAAAVKDANRRLGRDIEVSYYARYVSTDGIEQGYFEANRLSTGGRSIPGLGVARRITSGCRFYPADIEDGESIADAARRHLRAAEGAA